MSVVILFLFQEGRFLWRKQFVLHASPEDLAHWGRHFVVGYTDEDELLNLVRKNAIAGVYVTTRNWRGKSVSDFRAKIASWQDLRAQSGSHPLIISADQEGGIVSRLSPLLPPMPSLSTLADYYEKGEVEKIKVYAHEQAKHLQDLGITMNLAPVVDLQDSRSVMLADFHTRIYERAISQNPDVVGGIASLYCREMAAQGIRVTLKHFPGLGVVRGDTHLGTVVTTQEKSIFENRDWQPYKQVFADCEPAVMLSHVVATALDDKNPASLSAPVVTDVLRGDLGFSGPTITDDFGMASISERDGGVGLAARQALNAGVDLILVSYDPDLYYDAMYALLTD